MPQLEIDPVTQAVRVVMPEPVKGRGNPIWNHVTHSWDYPKPAADHPEAVDLHHHMRASDDGMPLPKEPEDHQAQGHVEHKRPDAGIGIAPSGQLEQRPISPSPEAVEAQRANHDKLMVALEQRKFGAPVLSTQDMWARVTGGWDLREFQRRNITRSESPDGFNHRLTDWTIGEWMNATFGELGEAANFEKKMNRIRTGARGNRPGMTMESLRASFAKELADAFIYLLLVAARAELDMPTIVEEKYAETSREIGYLEPILRPLSPEASAAMYRDAPPRGYKDDTAKEATMRFANGVADSLK